MKRIHCIRGGRSDAFGRVLVPGVQYDLDDALANSLILAGFASDASGTAEAQNLPFLSFPLSQLSGGGTTVLSASTSIALDSPGKKLYLPYTVAGAVTLTISGSSGGAEAEMVVIANGTNVPAVSGADAWLNNFGYVNSSGVRNLLSAWHDGDGRRFAWSQLETIVGGAPAPAPAPDTTAPTYGTPSIANATPGKIVVPVTEAVGLSSTLTGSATVTVAGASRTVSSAAVVGSTVEVTLASPVANAEAVVLSAPAGWVRDTAGNTAAAIVSQAVTNNVAPVGGAEDALTTDYRARATTAGITLNETHVAAADTFAQALRSAGLHTKVTRLNLAINDTLAATLVPFIGSTSDTSEGTVTFDPALGWSTDGSSGRLNTGTQGVAGNGGMGAYLRTTQPVENVARPLMGTSAAADNYRIIANRTPGVAAGSANGAVSNLHGTNVGYAGVPSGGMTPGAYHSIRRSDSNIELVRNGVSLNLNTTTVISGAVTATNPILVMALNTTSGTPSTFLAAGSRVSGYWLDDGTMSISEMATFYSAMQAFQTAMGRQV